jgi:tetratricopeptide (TPR) repeat protein
MNTDTPILSENFQQLYCNAALFENFSAWHPVRFTRILPFQVADPLVDDARLLEAEAALLANPCVANQLAVVEAFALCGLLSAEDAERLKSVLDPYDAEFFELMGDVYANADMFICALRWYREYIAVLEAQSSGARSDYEDVYASAGYCLYALGLFAEAITWTKSCVGRDLVELALCAVVTDYQAQLLGGRLLAIEGVTDRTRFTASTTQDMAVARQSAERLTVALKTVTPFREAYIDWVHADAPAPAPSTPAEGFPFNYKVTGCLPRHKMNLLFATVALADYLSGCGNKAEAQRFIQEAALLEPHADFVQDRLKSMV